MTYDVEYEVFKYICREADSYIPLQKLLKNHGLTFQESVKKAEAYQDYFFKLLKKYDIHGDNPVSICMDLIELLKTMPVNTELQFLYCAIITDRGLLLDYNPEERTKEQNIRNWLDQEQCVAQLMHFLQKQTVMQKRLQQVSSLLKKYHENSSVDPEEPSMLYELCQQYPFLCTGKNPSVFLENIGELIGQVNSCAELQALKPYLIFAVLSRKHKLMIEREHYIPNLQSVLSYQNYQIEADNGKNYDTYQTYVELYENLRRFYLDDPEVDIAFSDYCFANLSPLSEWYYQNCEPNEAIPMNLIRKIITIKAKRFPVIYNYHDYENFEQETFYQKYSDVCELWQETLENMPNLLFSFLQSLSEGHDIADYAEMLCVNSGADQICPKKKQLQQAAEWFLYQEASIQLEEQMLEAAEYLIK